MVQGLGFGFRVLGFRVWGLGLGLKAPSTVPLRATTRDAMIMIMALYSRVFGSFKRSFLGTTGVPMRRACHCGQIEYRSPRECG